MYCWAYEGPNQKVLREGGQNQKQRGRYLIAALTRSLTGTSEGEGVLLKFPPQNKTKWTTSEVFEVEVGRTVVCVFSFFFSLNRAYIHRACQRYTWKQVHTQLPFVTEKTSRELKRLWMNGHAWVRKKRNLRSEELNWWFFSGCSSHNLKETSIYEYMNILTLNGSNYKVSGKL